MWEQTLASWTLKIFVRMQNFKLLGMLENQIFFMNLSKVCKIANSFL